MGNIVERLFRSISDTVNGGERAILDALSSVVPYTTASIPAYMTYWHVLTYMEFPSQIAWLAAFTVEVLGVTAVSTAIRFWRWNKAHSKDSNRAPFWLAVGTYAFYILITLSVNVLLEVYAEVRSPAVIWAIALFSLLSIPSGVLISIRSQFGEMLEEKRERNEQRRQGGVKQKIRNDGSVLVPLNLDIPFGDGRDKIKKSCVVCGNDFVTTYPNKVTCSDACRKAKSRGKTRNVS